MSADDASVGGQSVWGAPRRPYPELDGAPPQPFGRCDTDPNLVPRDGTHLVPPDVGGENYNGTGLHRVPAAVQHPSVRVPWSRGHYRGGDPSPPAGQGGVGWNGVPAAPGPVPVAGGSLPREDLTANDFARVRTVPASHGWRKWLYKATFGAINVGESADEVELRQLTAAIKSPVSNTHSVAVVGGKGGTGKSVVTTVLGSIFSAVRRKDPVLAVDADPGPAANLPDRIAPSTRSTFSDILGAEGLRRRSDLHGYVGQNPESGLDVLAGQARGRPESGGLDADIYAQAREQLDLYYPLIVTDTGVDLGHAVIPAVLGATDSLVVVASAIPDGLAAAWSALNWIERAGFESLRARMICVINHIRPFDGRDVRKETDRVVGEMKDLFATRVSRDRIFEVPYDRHIAEAGVLQLDLLSAGARREFLRIAAAVAAGFSSKT